jgi:hypothetical protein
VLRKSWSRWVQEAVQTRTRNDCGVPQFGATMTNANIATFFIAKFAIFTGPRHFTPSIVDWVFKSQTKKDSIFFVIYNVIYIITLINLLLLFSLS